MKYWLSSFLVSRSPLSKKSWWQVQALEYQPREICKWNVATYKWKVRKGKIEITSKISDYTDKERKTFLYLIVNLNSVCEKKKH